MIDVLDNFLWTLRREGFAVSTAQALDVIRAASEVGFADRQGLREAIACVVVDTRSRRARYDQLFEEFFAVTSPRLTELTQRLLAQGLTSADLAALRELLREFVSPQGGALRRGEGAFARCSREGPRSITCSRATRTRRSSAASATRSRRASTRIGRSRR
jgi:uncharacterized protein with von Willebrand factor type A (vWA) domain